MKNSESWLRAFGLLGLAVFQVAYAVFAVIFGAYGWATKLEGNEPTWIVLIASITLIPFAMLWFGYICGERDAGARR